MVKLKVINSKGRKGSSTCKQINETEPEQELNAENLSTGNVGSKQELNTGAKDVNVDDVNAEANAEGLVVDVNAEVNAEEDFKADMKPKGIRPRKGRRVAGISSQVVKDAKVEEGDDVIVLRCRPNGVMDLFKNLTKDQMKAVKDIGFGSLSLIKLETFPTEMIRWLCGCFDTTTCQSYQLTAADVHDVFMIPMGKTEVPTSLKRQNSDLKFAWRSMYGTKNLDISVPLLWNKMINDDGMKKGNDDFKRCFVMFVMVTLLAPTSNRSADFKLVLALENVKEIHNFNWCKYVLNDLCEKLSSCSLRQKYFPGCVLLLQICYFHRLQVEGSVLDCSLPLIQHWTEETFRDRLDKENGKYGDGELDENTYPVTVVDDAEVEVDDVEVDDTDYSKKLQKKERKKVTCL